MNQETRTACDVALKIGDELLLDLGGGVIHFACCGPEPECYVDLETGEQLPEPPKPMIWSDDL